MRQARPGACSAWQSRFARRRLPAFAARVTAGQQIVAAASGNATRLGLVLVTECAESASFSSRRRMLCSAERPGSAKIGRLQSIICNGVLRDPVVAGSCISN